MSPATLLAALDAATAWELSASQLRLMIRLHLHSKTPFNPTLSNRPSDLATRLNLTCAGVGSAYKPLIKRGILHKTRNSEGDDERGVTLELLPYGQRMVDAILRGNPNPINPPYAKPVP